MRVAIISQYSKSYSARRLREACLERNFRVRILEMNQFLLQVESGSLNLKYRGTNLKGLKAIIPRVGTLSSFGGAVNGICSIVRQFEQSGVYCLQSAGGIAIATDKFRTMQELARYNIPIPLTVFVYDPLDVTSAIEYLGGPPILIKFVQSTQGYGVMFAEDVKVAVSIVQALQFTHHRILLQKCITESLGRDIRAFVVGDQVVAAMRRTAQAGEFRSNVHLGGTVERVLLDDEVGGVAVRAAQLLGLNVAGVDLLESKDGPLVTEVNASPGLEGIESVTGLDIAGAVVDHIPCDL
jgi:ribosomal protein S6--L-glutamate ligase